MENPQHCVSPQHTLSLQRDDAPYDSWLSPILWPALAAHHPGTPSRHALAHTLHSFYILKINILSFLRLGFWRPSLNFSIGVLGLPLSVSAPGFEAISLAEQGEESRGDVMLADLATWLKEHSSAKGLRVMMNVPFQLHWEQTLLNHGFVGLETLPTTILSHHFNSFEDYLNALRAPYRYRLKKCLETFDRDCLVRHLAPEDFGPELYALYEATYSRSQYPLEKMPLEYFQSFPAQLVAIYAKDGTPLGFYQYIHVADTFYFIFCGLSYEHLATYHTYEALLADLLRRAIDSGYRRIDFGQTTELMKLKLGFSLERRRVYAYHPQPLVRQLLRWLAKPGSYQLPTLPALHVFKKETP